MTSDRRLFLLPGLNNTRAVFDGVLTALDPQVQATTLDFPPLSDLDALADYALSVMPDTAHVCGFSFGGYVALAMLVRAPERFTGLALVGSLPQADSEAARGNRLGVIELARSGGYTEMVRANAAAAFHPDSLRDTAIMAERDAMVLAYGAERFIAHTRAAMERPDRTATLTDYRGPVLMMAGENDPLAPAERMEELVGRDHVRVIPGAGHLLPLEQPRAMARQLAAWVLD